MLGGGRVRRRSIDSGIERSPCINRVRKKNTALQHLARVLRFDQPEDESPDRMPSLTPDNSPHNVPERSATNSVASTSSEDLHDDEPDFMTRQGLFSLPNVDNLVTRGKEVQLPCKSHVDSCRSLL